MRHADSCRRSSAHLPTYHQDIDFETDELGREIAEPVSHASRIPVFNREILTLGVAKLEQPLPERVDEWVARRMVSGHADPGLLLMEGDDPAGIAAFIAAIARHRHFERETDPPRV